MHDISGGEGVYIASEELEWKNEERKVRREVEKERDTRMHTKESEE